MHTKAWIPHLLPLFAKETSSKSSNLKQLIRSVFGKQFPFWHWNPITTLQSYPGRQLIFSGFQRPSKVHRWLLTLQKYWHHTLKIIRLAIPSINGWKWKEHVLQGVFQQFLQCPTPQRQLKFLLKRCSWYFSPVSQQQLLSKREMPSFQMGCCNHDNFDRPSITESPPPGGKTSHSTCYVNS